MVSSPHERTYWIFGSSEAEFQALGGLIEALMLRYPRSAMLLTTPAPETRDWLRRRYPQAVVLPPPLPMGGAAYRYLVNLNVRGILWLGTARFSERAVLRAAERRALPIVHLDVAPAESNAGSTLAENATHHFVATPAAAERLLEAGTAEERISLLPADPGARSQAIMEVLAPLLAQDMKLLRSERHPIRRRLEQLALRAMNTPRLRRLLSVKAARYDSLEELRAALGNPQIILCLGNGPSSEDPAVVQTPHDALFRVNNLWLKRGLLTKPNMVFTASKATLAAVRGTIFGLTSPRSEARLLVARILNPRYGRMRYATIERLNLDALNAAPSHLRPTNGAIMVATAAALKPKRLVIAGIDLFSHPAGTYPGDTQTPNAYTAAHDKQFELDLLLAVLGAYQGEVVIISPPLREAWEAFRAFDCRHRQHQHD